MEWHHFTSPKKKKAKRVQSTGKVMGTVIWDAEEYILVLPKGETINGALHFRRSRNLNVHFRKSS